MAKLYNRAHGKRKQKNEKNIKTYIWAKGKENCICNMYSGMKLQTLKLKLKVLHSLKPLLDSRFDINQFHCFQHMAISAELFFYYIAFHIKDMQQN